MVISEKHFQQFIKGDEKSFESIFCQYYKTLVSYAMRHDLELMEAEDVVLEIFHHIPCRPSFLPLHGHEEPHAERGSQS